MPLNELENMVSRAVGAHSQITQLVAAANGMIQLLQASGKPSAPKLIADLEAAVDAACKALLE